MGKPNWNGLIRTVRSALSRHSAGILTGVGITGMITTTVLAVRATPAAVELLNEKKREKRTNKLPLKDTVKTAGKCYIPAAVTGALSVGCLIGASSVNERRNAALATAYALSETALKDYRDKVVQTVGERKERTIRDEVAKEQIARNPVNGREIVVTNRGNTLCYDNVSGRYFYSDMEHIQKAENTIDRRLRDEMCISLNEFYDELGLPRISAGDKLGWNIDKGYLEIYISAQIADDERTPCLTMMYNPIPEYEYR